MKKFGLFRIYALVLVICVSAVFASCASEEKNAKDVSVSESQLDEKSPESKDAVSEEKASGEKSDTVQNKENGEEASSKSEDEKSAPEPKPVLSEEEKKELYENATIIAPEPVVEQAQTEVSTKPQTVTDNRINPDISTAVVKPASAAVTPTPTEENFVDALENYANPNGNEYDALSVLGSFRYPEDQSALLERFRSVSADWHTEVRTQVGEKCVVDLSIKEKKAIDLSDSKVTQWNAANGKTAEAYSNVKCIVASNYSSDTVTMSIDIVKVDGNWYCASTSAIDNLKKTITTHIFK